MGVIGSEEEENRSLLLDVPAFLHVMRKSNRKAIDSAGFFSSTWSEWLLKKLLVIPQARATYLDFPSMLFGKSYPWEMMVDVFGSF